MPQRVGESRSILFVFRMFFLCSTKFENFNRFVRMRCMFFCFSLRRSSAQVLFAWWVICWVHQNSKDNCWYIIVTVISVALWKDIKFVLVNNHRVVRCSELQLQVAASPCFILPPKGLSAFVNLINLPAKASKFIFRV